MTLWKRRHSTSSTKGEGPRSHSTRKYGLEVLYDPGNAIVDIIFIHGLTGHPELTWKARSSAGLWPQTLLPSKIPMARILTYGYDAGVIKFGSVVSSNAVGDHSRNFLSTLATYRAATEDTAGRPIIFVAHSLGGLVCQEALLASELSAEKHLQRILECTLGIAFFGTPHSGAGLASSAYRLARWIGHVKNANSSVIDVLCEDSEVLYQIQHNFHSMLRARLEEGCPRIEITCFYEELELQIPRFGKVVSKSSATLPGYTAIGIHSNHTDMVRFATEHDPGFINFVGELKRWVAGVDIALDRFGTLVADGKDVASDISSFKEMAGSRSAITIGGNIVKSIIVNGSQVIHGGLTIGD